MLFRDHLLLSQLPSSSTFEFSILSSDSEPEHLRIDHFNPSQTPALTQSPSSSLPPTPNSLNTSFGARLHANAMPEQRSGNVHGT